MKNNLDNNINLLIKMVILKTYKFNDNNNIESERKKG